MYLYRRFDDANSLQHAIQWLSRLGIEARAHQSENDEHPQLVASTSILMMTPLKQFLDTLEDVRHRMTPVSPDAALTTDLAPVVPELTPTATPIHWYGREESGPTPIPRSSRNGSGLDPSSPARDMAGWPRTDGRWPRTDSRR